MTRDDDEVNLVWTMVGDILILVWLVGSCIYMVSFEINVYLTLVET